MGLLDRFSRKSEESGPVMMRLPTGSVTVDREGHVITSTLPHSFPESQVKEIVRLVLGTFKSAKELNMPLTDLTVHYAALRLTAHELRGGAIIFLAPRTMAKS